jgi:DNA (cytosine-5)-methyltransferase 1
LNELAIFSGAGGGILGGKLLGWRTVCAVEIERYPACVLVQRQNNRFLPPFPIWDDIRTFDGRPWREIVDVVSGGFPCQDISCAGTGTGLSGKRSGLWFEMLRIIRGIRPRYAFVENSPMLTSRGLDTVLGGLAEIGYDAEWCVLGASDCGAPHYRKRFWILAYTERTRQERYISKTREKKKPEFRNGCANVPDSNIVNGHLSRYDTGKIPQYEATGIRENTWWETEPGLGRVANGVACRVDRLKAIGNGQVPSVAATAWNVLWNRLQG